MKSTRPLWVDPSLSAYPSLREDIDADVVVVGAGIAGVGAAHWLRQGGVERVVVLERRTVAAGATGRNAGFVMAVAPENFPASADEVEVATARRIWKYTSVNQSLIEQTIDELELSVDYEKRGSLQLAASETEWTQTLRSVDLARSSGLRVHIVSRSDLPGVWLRQNYLGAAWFGDNAQMQPAAFVRGLADDLSGHGVRFYERTDVRTLSSAGSQLVLSANDRRVECQKVVVATNAYTSDWFPDLGKWIAPKRGQVLATWAVSNAPAPCPVYANNGYQYWRQTPDGTLVVGGWRDVDFNHEVGTRHSLHGQIQDELERMARHLSCESTRIRYRWSGIMGFTPDSRPMVGLSHGDPRVAIAAGFSGHGLAMAFMSGREAVGMLLGVDSEYSDLFDPARFTKAAI